MVLEVYCEKLSVVVDEFKFITCLTAVNLDGTVAVGAVDGVSGRLIAIEGDIRITDRARIIFHGKAP
jgi:hypothetical protein